MHISRLLMLAMAGLLALAPHAGWTAEYKRLEVRFLGNTTPAPGLDALVRELERLAEKRDLAGIRKKAGSQLFWEQDFGARFDSNASAADNLVAALSLDGSRLAPEYQGWGWARLSLIIGARTTMIHDDRQGVICMPGAPAYIDEPLAEEVFSRTGTDSLFDWAFVENRDVAVWPIPDGDQPPIGSFNSEAARVIAWQAVPPHENAWKATRWAEVQIPDGRRGFVESQLLWSWSPERLCFAADGDGVWTIVGYRGGGD